MPQYFDFFLAWNGIEKADFDKENPADVRAAERFAKLYDVVVKDNPDATRKGLNLFLIRILFCLFAEDTNIFEHDLFTNRVKQMTANDGSNFDQFIGSLFGVLDFEKTQRPIDTPSWLNDFPYVDGDLFKDQHESLHFSAKSRKLIIEAGELLKWDQINPDILGSMIQAVASEDSRSHLGMHYTSVPNIMKVIKPLFLDGLREDFEAAKGNENKLQELYDRIGKIKFMDPACGSGNFLIITYKELRQLEIDILIELNNIGVSTMYVPSVTLNQFYGIEIDDFACDVTRLSLWIAEHQMNVRLHDQVNDAIRPTLPLQHTGAIVNSNALTVDWQSIMPRRPEDEGYIFGNPPYLGARNQTDSQKSDLARVFSDSKVVSKLDYVCGWFMLAAKYQRDTRTRSAFVTTNSINQGEQVERLWNRIFQENMDITFAYNSFQWSNNAKGQASVFVVIIGLADKLWFSGKRYLYKEKFRQQVERINAYLVNAPNLIVESRSKPLFFQKMAERGSSPTDGRGGLILSEGEYFEQISKSPESKKFFRRYINGSDFLNEKKEYCIWIESKDEAQVASSNSFILSRFKYVEDARLNSGKKELAKTPYRFEHVKNRDAMAIFIPQASSGNRQYIPMGYVDNDVVVAAPNFAVYDGSLIELGLLMSHMHMVWINAVCGKFKEDYRYSNKLCYNTFPIPVLSDRRIGEIEALVYQIIDLREEIGGSLASLYGSPMASKNPKPMNERLAQVHQQLDKVVDSAYQKTVFEDDTQRLGLLLNMYEKKVKSFGK